MNNIEAERVRKCFTKELSVETLVRIAEVLGVTADYLLNDTINMHSDKIMVQISQSFATLNDDEKLFFLNVIKSVKI